MKKIIAATALLVLTIPLSACVDKQENTERKVLSVRSGSSIQEVIDAANPGDVIVIEPGTYKGNIVVTKEDITLRGENRNTVIIDGKYEQDNGITAAAGGIRIENLTVQAFRINGILIQGGYVSDTSPEQSTDEVLSRYKVSYVNALNNGLYGIYAFSASDGTIDNTYTRANADAGIYIGQCKPCTTAVYNNVAELNGIGFQGANASEDLAVYSNIFSNNRTGIHLLSETKEKKSPQESVSVVSNVLSTNNADGAPTTTPDLYGFGIVVAGGQNNLVENNRTNENAQVGIALVENGEFLPMKNTIRGNESRGNGFPVGFDIAFIISGRNDVMSQGNCFENNSYSSSSVDKIEEVLLCTGAGPGPFASQPFKKFVIPDAPTYSDIAIEAQDRTPMPGDVNEIPKKIGKLKMPDLSELTLPN